MSTNPRVNQNNMQLPKKKFDAKAIEEFLQQENKFITNLMQICCVPERKDQTDDVSDTENEPQQKPFKGDKTRATSLTELQERLSSITSKKKLTYKEKLERKGIKNRIKKKSKQDERNAKQKLIRAQKTMKVEVKTDDASPEESTEKLVKPVYNSEDKIVYSKIDFSGIGDKKKQKKQEKDPKKLLENLAKENEQLKQLAQSGETDKAIEIKEKKAWKNALAKAEGVKVKDDPSLLKKTLKKQQQKQKQSKKKWEARIAGVEKGKQERQKKRAENIQKKKKDKKVHKLKNAAKRGKIIPGF